MAKAMTGGWINWLVLIVGILFLLRDFGVWNFWNISGWTALFVMAGLYWVFGKQ